MLTISMQRLTMAALVLGCAGGVTPLSAQAAGGAPRPARPTASRIDDAELARALAREQAVRMQLVARIESLAARLESRTELSGTQRRRLQADLERSIRQLTETHARTAVDVGSRIILQHEPAIATSEVRRSLSEAQRRLTSAARIGYVGITLSPTNNHVRAEESGELYVRYFARPTIISVEPNSPAERAGLQRGDVVVSYNDMDVRSELPMHDVLRPGNSMQIRVRRAGRERDVRLTVAAPPANVLGRRTDFLVPSEDVAGRRLAPLSRGAAERGRATASGRGSRTIAPGAAYRFEFARGIAGAELSPITAGLASALGVKKGLLVMRVAERSPAAAAGLRDGDIVLKANGHVTDDIAALSRVMRRHDEGRSVTLETVRQKKKRMVRLTW